MSESAVVAEARAAEQRVISEVEESAATAIIGDRIYPGLEFRLGDFPGTGERAQVVALNRNSVEVLTGARLKKRMWIPLARAIEYLNIQASGEQADGAKAGAE